MPLAEARQMYDGLSSAVGKQIAEDTLAEYQLGLSLSIAIPGAWI